MLDIIYNLRKEGITITDERVKLMSEIITAVKLVKMYAWEKSFAKKIKGKICMLAVLDYMYICRKLLILFLSLYQLLVITGWLATGSQILTIETIAGYPLTVCRLCTR